jgi:hypothetical protein
MYDVRYQDKVCRRNMQHLGIDHVAADDFIRVPRDLTLLTLRGNYHKALLSGLSIPTPHLCPINSPACTFYLLF